MLSRNACRYRQGGVHVETLVCVSEVSVLSVRGFCVSVFVCVFLCFSVFWCLMSVFFCVLVFV